MNLCNYAGGGGYCGLPRDHEGAHEPTKRCGARSDYTCVEYPGHSGMHRDLFGTSWTKDFATWARGAS